MHFLILLLSALFLSISSFSVATDEAFPSGEEMYVEANNTKLFCRVMGKSSPVIVIHGGPGCCSQGYLLPAMAKLAEHHQVIFYDQRGSGNSVGPVDESTIKLDYFIEDVEAIRQAFHFEKISILGHSWGGHLAMHYAIHHPEHIDKLILVSSAAATSSDFALYMKEGASRLSSHAEEMQTISQSAAFLSGDPDLYSQYMKIIFRTYTFSPKDADKLNFINSATANVNGFKTYSILEESYLSRPFDLTDGLRKLKCQTLIIHGDSDPIPMQTAHHLNDSIPGSTLVILNQCGHFPYVEKPEQFFSEINAFLGANQIVK
jgi:proline iminopeptidase